MPKSITSHTSSNASCESPIEASYNSRPIPTRWAPWPVNRNATPARARDGPLDTPAGRLADANAPSAVEQLLALTPNTTARRSNADGPQARRQRHASQLGALIQVTPQPRQPARAGRRRLDPTSPTAATTHADAVAEHHLIPVDHSTLTDHRSRGPESDRPGASSRITCALVPLIPNEDTPARRGARLAATHLLGEQRHRAATNRPRAKARRRAASAAAHRDASPSPS